MATQGPLYPGTAASLSNAGSSENAEAWVSPSSISTDDGSTASITAATYDSPDISQLLVASNFGFSIPTGSTINGIVVEVDRNNAAGAASDNRVQLATGTTFGTLVGDNKAATSTDWPASLTVATYGGSGDTWSAGLTVAQINASGFAVMLSVQADAANTDVAVDFIRVTVHYTPPALTADNDYETEVFADSPSVVFSMEESSGSITDLIGGLTGTASGGPTYGVTGPVSGKTAIHLDASGDYFSVADNAALDLGDGPLTIEGFVNPDSIGSQMVVWGKNDNDDLNNPVVTVDASGVVSVYKAGVGLIVSSTTTVPPSTWTHFAYTKSGTTHALYLNGTDRTGSVTHRTLASNNAISLIGTDPGPSLPFVGGLAYLAYYKSALSSTRIAAHYAALATGTTFTADLSGALSFAGAVARSGRKPLAGALTTSGSVVRRVNRGFTASLGTAGSLAKRTGRGLTGGLAPSGALTATRTVLKALTGQLTTSGSLARRTGRPFAGALTSGGALSRRVNKALAGGLSFSGAASTARTVVQSFTGALTTSGSLAKRTDRPLAGSLSFSGSIAKSIRRALAGALEFAGSILGERSGQVVLGEATLTMTNTNSASLTATASHAASITLTNTHVASLILDRIYDFNDTITVAVSFAVSGTATDPTTVTLRVYKPDGDVDVYTYAQAEITKSGTGSYTKSITADQRGVWLFRYEGTGTCQAAVEDTATVRS